jgi:hypothetical protein
LGIREVRVERGRGLGIRELREGKGEGLDLPSQEQLASI